MNPVPMVDGHELTLILENFSNAQPSGYTLYRVDFENSSWLTGSAQDKCPFTRCTLLSMVLLMPFGIEKMPEQT